MSTLSGNRVVPRAIVNRSGTKTINLDLFINQSCSVLNNGTILVNGLVSGDKNLRFSGSGTTEFTNNNTYTGSVQIAAGTVKLSGSAKLNMAAGKTHLINGVLDYSSSQDMIIAGKVGSNGLLYLTPQAVFNNNSKIIVNGPGVLHFRNPFRDNWFDGTLEINAGGYVKVGNNDTLASANVGNGTGSLHRVTRITQNGTLEFYRNATASVANVNAVLSGTGDVKFTAGGSIVFAGGGDFSGNFILDAGTNVTLSKITPNAVFLNDGTLTLNITSTWNTNYIFSATVAGSTTSYVYLTDYTVGTGIGAANVTAQIQAAGFGNDPSEFTGFVAGRIALVQRGVQTFQTKVNNAVAAGASAVIIYNNTTGLTTPSLTTTVPVVFITQELGTQLAGVTGASATINTASAGAPFNNTVTGMGTLVKAGDQPLTVALGNTFAGILSVTGNTLRVAASGGFGNASSVRPAAGTAVEILGGQTIVSPFVIAGTGISSGGVIRNISGDNTLSGAITQTAASRINSDSGLLVLSGTVSGAFGLTVGGAGNTRVDGVITTPTTLTKDGAGTLELTAANTYTSTTTISAGTLKLTGAGTVGASSIVNNAALVIENNDGTTIARAISGTGTLTKNLNTKVIFTATLSHTGVTTINAGTFAVGAGGTAGDMSGAGSVVVNSGATLEINRNNASTFSRPLSGAGALVVLGGGTASFTGALTHTGGTTVSAGTMSIGAGSTTGSITGNIVNNATLQFNRSDALTYSGVISGTGNVTKSAAGTTTLSGNNTYSGTTTIISGALRVAHTNALGSATSTVSIPANTAIELTGGVTFSRNLSSAGTGISSGGSLRNISGNNTFGGNYTLTNNSRINSDADTLTIGSSGTLTGNFGLTLGGAGNINVERPIATGTGTLTKDGAGTVTLSAASTRTGSTTISGGTLRAGNATCFGTGTITLNAGATLDRAGFTLTNTVVNNGGTIIN